VRGRKPRPLTLAARDVPILQAVVRARHLAWFQVQHARIVLALAAGESIEAIAARMECDRATVWCVCRRYDRLRPPSACAQVTSEWLPYLLLSRFRKASISART